MSIKGIVEQYEETHKKSKELFERALKVFPNGTTHNVRHSRPFPIYVNNSKGCRKWDVDGNEYVDYLMGHGALILGHGRPEVVKAVQEQVAKGTHWGACHELEVEWGELIKKLVPSVDRLRFVGSGTEANMMAVRLARAFTGKKRIVKFEDHFGGWFDHLMVGIDKPYDKAGSAGMLEEDVKYTTTIPVNDPAKLEQELAKGDVAVVLMEGAGAHAGSVPVEKSLVQQVGPLAKKYGAVFLLDEVITGFRWSPGGWQAKMGVKPDMTTFAKILAGGLPGGAVGGRADIMEHLEIKDDPEWNRWRRMPHPGTFNANPLSAAAGIAALKIIQTGVPNRRADEAAARLRRGFNIALKERGISGAPYGDSSVVHVYFGPKDFEPKDDTLPPTKDAHKLTGVPAALKTRLSINMLQRGVHNIRGTINFLSMEHDQAAIDHTVKAFEQSLDAMIAEGMFEKGK